MHPEFERNVSIDAVMLLLLLCVVADYGDDYRSAGLLCSGHSFGPSDLLVIAQSHTYTGPHI